MLQSLRDKAQGWIAWIIIGLIAITFILFGTENFFSSNASSHIVAKVQGSEITSQELDNAYKRYVNQAGDSVAQLDQQLVKKELLQSMIDETIMMDDAAKMGLTVSAQRIGLMLNSIPFFLVDGNFSPDAYQRFLISSGYTDASFKNYIKTALIKQQLEQGLMQTAFSLPTDLQALVKFILQKRDFRYFTISRQSFEKQVNTTEDEIRAFYDKHLENFKTPEKVSLEYVVLSLPKIAQAYQPKEEDVQAYFSENSAAFHQPERVEVEHILVAVPKNAKESDLITAKERILAAANRIKKGESFEKVAKEVSDDTASKQNGGKLEWINKGEMIPEFEKAAFNLHKKNDVSEPVRTDFGYHLIKLIDKQAAKAKKLDEVKNEIISKMKHEWAQDKFAKMGDDLNDLAFDYPDSLQPVIDKLGLELNHSEFFSKLEGPKESLLQNPNVIAAAFNSQVKDDKNNSELIKLDEENYLVLRVGNVQASTQKPLDEVKPEITKTIVFEKTEQLAKAQAKADFDKIVQDKMPLDKVQTAFTWTDAKEVTRNTTTPDPQMVEAVFGMANPSSSGSFKELKHDNGDYSIIWLTKVENGDISKISEQERQSFSAQLAKHYGELEFALYVTQLIKDAKVQKFEDRI
ncbi:MAG: SurA N-terminal domain-containing protein [Candidatus Berkiella sp.]